MTCFRLVMAHRACVFQRLSLSHYAKYTRGEGEASNISPNGDLAKKKVQGCFLFSGSKSLSFLSGQAISLKNDTNFQGPHMTCA